MCRMWKLNRRKTSVMLFAVRHRGTIAFVYFQLTDVGIYGGIKKLSLRNTTLKSYNMLRWSENNLRMTPVPKSRRSLLVSQLRSNYSKEKQQGHVGKWIAMLVTQGSREVLRNLAGDGRVGHCQRRAAVLLLKYVPRHLAHLQH